MLNTKHLLVNKFLTITLCMVVVLVAQYFFMQSPWAYDAADYWNRGDVLKSSGFKLSSIDGFRGYIFPLYLAVINSFGGRNCWYLINSIIIALFMSFVIPQIATQDNKHEKREIIKCFSFCVLITVLFVGVVCYPLADMFAIVLMCTATFCAKKSLETKKLIIKIVLAFLAGVCSYLSYNTRTIYLFAGILLALVYAVLLIKQKNVSVRKRITNLLAYETVGFFGMFIAAIPQIIMNQIHLGVFSISVPTNNLMLQQIFWGLKYQRYDTYMPFAVDAIHPEPQVYFVDYTGWQILSEMNMDSFENWGDFFLCLISRPIDVFSIYVRHLVNFIFPCWPEIYVTDLNSTKWLFGILGFSVFFLIALILIKKYYKSSKNIVYFIPIITPGILIIPGAVEYRFSLPLYVFALGMICFNTDWKKVKNYFVTHKWSVLLVYLITAMLCFSIWSNMLASENVTPLLF